jgi:hypothetical protein
MIGPLTSDPQTRTIALAALGAAFVAWGGYVAIRGNKKRQTEAAGKQDTTEELIRQLIRQNEDLARRLTLAGIPELPPQEVEPVATSEDDTETPRHPAGPEGAAQDPQTTDTDKGDTR